MNPMRPINDGIEDTEYFLLLCDSFKEHRCNLLTNLLMLLFKIEGILSSLYGDESLPYEVNRSILTLTITYILKTERLD